MRNDKINCYNLFEKYLVAHIELYGGKGYEYMRKGCVAGGRVRRYLPGNSIWKISEHDFFYCWDCSRCPSGWCDYRGYIEEIKKSRES